MLSTAGLINRGKGQFNRGKSDFNRGKKHVTPMFSMNVSIVWPEKSILLSELLISTAFNHPLGKALRMIQLRISMSA